VGLVLALFVVTAHTLAAAVTIFLSAQPAWRACRSSRPAYGECPRRSDLAARRTTGVQFAKAAGAFLAAAAIGAGLG